MKKQFTSFLFLALLPFSLLAQEFLFQGWTWNYPVLLNGKRYAQRMAQKAPELKNAGFTHVWVPPMSRGSSGATSMGYDPKDLYDLGEFASSVRLGIRPQIDAMISAFDQNNLTTVADLVLNHRDFGKPEVNPAVQGWITNFNNPNNCPYPSGNFRCILPIGGNTGLGVGKYYVKLSSATQSANFNGFTYKFTAWTNKSGFIGNTSSEQEPNGGGDCAEPYDSVVIGNSKLVTIENNGGCATDEFMIELKATDFNASGDTLYFIMPNLTLSLSTYSDHRIYGIWYSGTNSNIVSQVLYQTNTDFSSQPSGRGGMHWDSFHPNGGATTMCSDLDAMWFFYDYDQNNPTTRDTLFEWAKWMHQSVGVNGIRVDAVKHFPASFLGDMLDYLHDNNIDPSIVVGEYFDYNAFTLKGWVDAVLASMDNDTKTAIYPRIFDFALRNALKNACETPGYDVRNLYTESMRDKAGASGYNVVTFVNNHDYEQVGGLIDNNVALAYAYILTNNQLGVPCVFDKDYYGPSTDTSLHVRKDINALMKVHKKYIAGAQSVDYLNKIGSFYTTNIASGYPHTTLFYQLRQTGMGKDVFVGVNFSGDTLKLNHTINGTDIAPGDTITDMLGTSKYPYAIVQPNYSVDIQLPPNSYAVWVEGDHLSEVTSVQSPLENSGFISLSPNPFTNYIEAKIWGKANENAHFEVFTLEGKQIYQRNLGKADATYDIFLPQLPAGVYLMKVTVGEKSYYQKMVK